MTNAIKPVATATSNAPAVITSGQQIAMVNMWTKDFDQLTKSQGYELTKEEREFGASMITGLVTRCVKDKVDTSKLNMTTFLEDVKHQARMGMSLAEQDVFLDIRNNSATGLKDVTIRRQYQGVQKIMQRYSSKKIVRFADGIVCNGDTFSNEFDFSTGLYKIKYAPNAASDHNKLENITHAFAIAYVEELGQLVPYACVIDKQRIMRAFNASAAKDRGPWSTDTARMVRKTAYWCLYNDIFKPFIQIPSNLQDSFAATEDEMDFSNTGDAVESADGMVYDLPTDDAPANDFTVEAEPQEAHEQSFEEYLASTDEPSNEEKEVYYSEYKNNKEKYNLVEGSYDATKKTCRVTLK